MSEQTRPPNLRESESDKNCGNCKYYHLGENQHGVCTLYADYPVDSDDLCDSWESDLKTQVKDVVSAVASPYGLHGPNSLLGVQGLGSPKKKKKRKLLSDTVIGSKTMADNSGFLVSGKEGDHLPTRKNGKVDHGLMGAAWAALHGGYRGNTYQGPNQSEAISKLTALYKSEGLPTPGSDEKAKVKSLDPHSAFTQFKQPDGRWRWVLTSSSGFDDRDSESIPTNLLSQDSTRMKATNTFGPLRWHHVGSENANPITRDPGKGLDLGACDYSEMHAHTRVDSGNYYKEAIGDALQPHLKSLGGSLGYFHSTSDPDHSGTYTNPIWTFERSILPKESASNWMARTLKQLLHKEADVNQAAVKTLKEKLGLENSHLVDELLSGIDQKESTLLNAGVGVKQKKDEEKENPKEEASESPEEEKKEDAEEADAMKKKTKELVDAISDSIALKMKDAFISPAQLDAKFAELTAVGTKATDEQKVALKELGEKFSKLDSRMSALEGETPDSKKGFKASGAADSLVTHPLMVQALASLAETQGLDLSQLGVKGIAQKDDVTRITERMMSHGKNGQ